MSAPHTVGFECEIDSASRDADDFVEPLISAGLWSRPDAYAHGYSAHSNHCRCASCEWGGSEVRPMTDCTCTAELVSDPLDWPSANAEAILVKVSDVLDEMQIKPGTRAGCHIHVAKAHDEPTHNTKAWFSWYEHGFVDLARQSMPFLRGYNNGFLGCETGARPDLPIDKQLHHQRTQGGFRTATRLSDTQRWVRATRYHTERATGTGKGPNLSDRGDTWEFRIWNAVVSYWRLYLAIEVSCAFLDAARTPFPNHWTEIEAPTLVDFIAPHLTNEGFGYVLRHLADATDVDASSERKEGLL